MKTMRTAIGGVSLATLLILTGCGSDTKTPNDSTDSTSTPTTGASRSGGFDAAQFQKIRDCLKAAGLDDVFPTDLPSDLPTDRPTGTPPESFDPNNLPSDFPTDGAGPGGGGGLGALQDPDVQAALKACGIELPQRPDSTG